MLREFEVPDYKPIPSAWKTKPIMYRVNGDCWECVSHRISRGYPVIDREGKLKPMSRYVYEKHNGVTIPDGKIILHSCDNRLCINPSHLRIGTHEENMKDMTDRERQMRGSGHYKAILTEDDVKEIKRLLRTEQFTQTELGDKFGVTRYTISKISKGKQWKHVE